MKDTNKGHRRTLLFLSFQMVLGLCLFGASVELHQSPSRIDVKIDGKPFTTYYFDSAIAKPYLMPLRTASGHIMSRDFPIGNKIAASDVHSPSFEPHQRPLYFSHGDINGLDFWQEQTFDSYYRDHGNQAYGHMVLKQMEDVRQDQQSATIRSRFTLNDPSNRVLGEETQSFTFFGDKTIRIIDCEFTLYATAGPLDIGDSKEGTFGIRLANELSANGRILNSNGAIGGSTWGKRANWVDFSGIISGKQVGITVLEHPKSFRHPTTWHVRQYGLLAANPFGLRAFEKNNNVNGSWNIPEGESLTFRYRVLLHEGDFPSSRIAKAYQEYIAGD